NRPWHESTGYGTPRSLLACSAGWARPVRCLSALLQAARRPTRVVLCARPARWADRAHHLRAFVRVFHRSDSEKTTHSFAASHTRPVVGHGGVQPDLQILPELGYLQGP